MSTKDCPSCGAVVPASATRCKECFHDFTEEPEPAGFGSGPLLLLGTLAGMALVGGVTFWWIASQPVDGRILVDEATQSVIWTNKYRNRVETDRLAFGDIIKLEYVLRATGGFEIVAVTVDGDRRIIEEDTRPLRTEANQYAQLMDKPLEEVDNTRGFHTLGED